MARIWAYFFVKDSQPIPLLKSAVRAILSLGGHFVAAMLLFRGTTMDPADVPGWLTAIFALVITWYFATNEGGPDEDMPRWQGIMRSVVRSCHAIGGGAVVAILFMREIPVPNWWIAIYISILTFYFIELTDSSKKPA